MNTITVNGTTFTGEMILNAVERTNGFPRVGLGSLWYPHQLVMTQEYESIKKKLWNNHLDLVDSGEIPAGPCYSIWEVKLGGWRFLYDADGRGDYHTRCFSF